MELKDAGDFQGSIDEFARIKQQGFDEKNISDLMIGLLYFHELENTNSALPHAKLAVKQKPASEMASICLTHCLIESELHQEVNAEIRRYLASGGKVKEYELLLSENGLKIEDFT